VSATGPYTVQYDPKALKELIKLDKPTARRIVKAVDAMSLDPRPSGARPLVGYPDLWRIRVGDHRVVYTFKDAELVVLALSPIAAASHHRRSTGSTSSALDSDCTCPVHVCT
jgi:mRNA interferase RelE/StbE